MHTITMHIEGGVVHNVEGIPAGVLLVTRDYDVEGIDEPERIKEDGNGEYVESVYVGETSAPEPLAALVEALKLLVYRIECKQDGDQIGPADIAEARAALDAAAQ